MTWDVPAASMRITIPDMHCRGSDLRRPPPLALLHRMMDVNMQLSRDEEKGLHLPEQIDSVTCKGDMNA